MAGDVDLKNPVKSTQEEAVDDALLWVEHQLRFPLSEAERDRLVKKRAVYYRLKKLRS